MGNLICFFKTPVSIGSLEHILPILITLGIGFFCIRFSKKQLNIKQQQKVFHCFGTFISLAVFLFHLYYIIIGDYNFNTDLPLYLCSLIALFSFVFTYYKSYFLFEILLFWIILGTTQGILTPDIPIGFPSLDYFRYWVVHLGMLLLISYAIYVFNWRPTVKSVFKSFLALQVYLVCVMVINSLLNANYGYLNSKPNSASVLDYLGDWPYYIIVIELVLLPLFFLVYLPFYMAERRKTNEI